MRTAPIKNLITVDIGGLLMCQQVFIQYNWFVIDMQVRSRADLRPRRSAATCWFVDGDLPRTILGLLGDSVRELAHAKGVTTPFGCGHRVMFGA